MVDICHQRAKKKRRNITLNEINPYDEYLSSKREQMKKNNTMYVKYRKISLCEHVEKYISDS